MVRQPHSQIESPQIEADLPAESLHLSPTTNNSSEKYTDLSQQFKIISEIRPIRMMVFFGLVLVLGPPRTNLVR